MTSEASRLHRAGIAVLTVRALRRAALPIAAAAAATLLGNGLDRAGLQALAIALAGVAYALVAGAASWYSTSYGATREGIGLRSGVLSRRETYVRRSRIQALDITQDPLQRLFGVVQLEVQTAGGSEGGELTLVAVGAAEAERLQQLLQPAPAVAGAAAARGATAPRPAAAAGARPAAGGGAWGGGASAAARRPAPGRQPP